MGMLSTAVVARCYLAARYIEAQRAYISHTTAAKSVLEGRRAECTRTRAVGCQPWLSANRVTAIRGNKDRDNHIAA